MLFFGITLAAGILVLLGVQKLDIECLNPPQQRPAPSFRVRARSVEVRLPERPNLVNLPQQKASA
jgi:hypothetical protein